MSNNYKFILITFEVNVFLIDLNFEFNFGDNLSIDPHFNG